METHFQKELQELKECLLKMAGLVEGALSSAVQSLVKRDSELAQKTFDYEDRISKMEITIDEMWPRILSPRLSLPKF